MRFLRRKEKEKTVKAVEKTRRAWFGQVASLFRGAKLDNELWDELEELLIASDVGVATTQELLERLRKRVRDERVSEPEAAFAILKQEMVALLAVDDAGNRLDVEGKPLVILVVGVNGVGKTTSIAKLTHIYQAEGKQVLLGAADTFRAAAIEQLQVWGERLGVDVIAHKADADPGAVAFDALQAAKARKVDVLIIDTAGRLHSKTNLMEEIKKVQRVLKRKDENSPQRVLLTLDATTGQNGLHQARAFTEALNCDGVFLSKLDGTAKGGVVVSITRELQLPVLFVGTGEGLDDITPFDPQEFIEALFGSAGTAHA
jgi:fused signal recognition particle receptor